MNKGSKPSVYKRKNDRNGKGTKSAWPKGLEWMFLRLNKMRKLKR